MFNMISAFIVAPDRVSLCATITSASSRDLAKRKLQTTSTTTALPSRRVRRRWRDVLNSANPHSCTSQRSQSRLRSWPWGLRSVSFHMLVWTSSIRRTCYVPPVARILTCRAVIPSSLHLAAASCAANMAAYGDDSSRSAFQWTLVGSQERLWVSPPPSRHTFDFHTTSHSRQSLP